MLYVAASTRLLSVDVIRDRIEVLRIVSIVENPNIC
jgi:hypothetical protein